MSSSDVRRHIKNDLICLNTFKQYLTKLTAKVEKNISRTLPYRIYPVFDGQTTPEPYYIAVFATFTSYESDNYESVCLALLRLENEDEFHSDEHVSFLKLVLMIYGK